MKTRRTDGQRAIAAAEAWIMAEQAWMTRGKKGTLGSNQTGQETDEYFARLFGASRVAVVYARALLQSDLDEAAKVKAREDPL